MMPSMGKVLHHCVIIFCGMRIGGIWTRMCLLGVGPAGLQEQQQQQQQQPQYDGDEAGRELEGNCISRHNLVSAAAQERGRGSVCCFIMKAVVISRPGHPEVLELREVEDPVAGEGEVVIKIVAAAINGADTQQRQGQYPPPPGASLYPGLECSGVVEAVGSGVSKWKIGDEVCALLGGGGYAEKVNVPAGQLLPIPKGVSLRDAAGIPEVACTVWSTIFMTVHLTKGESLLIHGGGSGIGTFAIQIAKAKGVKVFVTAGSDEKVKECIKLGADSGINYKTEDFVERVKALTGGKGVDVILDVVGAPYLNRNLEALAIAGRLFIIGYQAGLEGEINLGAILSKRLAVAGAGLRSRTKENKAQIVQEVIKNVWPEIEAGKVKIVIDEVFPLGKAAEAHHAMERSHFGKILLTC